MIGKSHGLFKLDAFASKAHFKKLSSIYLFNSSEIAFFCVQNLYLTNHSRYLCSANSYFEGLLELTRQFLKATVVRLRSFWKLLLI